MNDEWKNTREKGPRIKTKDGEFEASIWKWKKIIPPREQHDNEGAVEVEQVCLRFGAWNPKTDDWNERSIWCSVDELRALIEVVEKMDFKDKPCANKCCCNKCDGDKCPG